MPAPPGRDTCRATAAGTSIPGCRRPTLGEPCRHPFSPAGLTALRPCFFSDPLPRPYNLLFWQPGEKFLQLVLALTLGASLKGLCACCSLSDYSTNSLDFLLNRTRRPSGCTRMPKRVGFFVTGQRYITLEMASGASFSRMPPCFTF